MRPWAVVPSFTARYPAMLKWLGLLVRLGAVVSLIFQRTFSVISIRTFWSWMIMDTRGSTSDMIQTWYFLRVRTRMLLLICSDLSSTHVFDVFSIFWFYCFWCLTQYSFVMHRSYAITTGRDVTISTEGCFTRRCGFERYHRWVRHRSRRGGGIIDSVDDLCSPHQGWRYPCPYASSC